MKFDVVPLYFGPIKIGSINEVSLTAAGPDGGTRYERLADKYFLGSFLSLDMESPEAFNAFVMSFGIEAFWPLLPRSFWVGDGGLPTKQYFFYKVGKSDTWDTQDVKAVREKTRAKVKAAQGQIRKALEAEDVEALAILAYEHCKIMVNKVTGEGHHPKVEGADVIGAAALYAIERLTVGGRVYDRYLNCERCGKPIPLERAKSKTCSQVCQNRISNRKRVEEMREAARMREAGKRRYYAQKWEEEKLFALRDDINAILNDKALKKNKARTMEGLYALADKYDIKLRLERGVK